MSDMGIGGAFGAEGASDALRQLIQDRLAKQQAEQLTALRQSQEQRLAEEHSANMQDRRDATAQRVQGERDTSALKALPNLGIGTAVEAPDFAKSFAGTSAAPNFTPERTLPSTQMAGGMPLDLSQPSVQTTTEAPRTITGRMISMGTDAQRGDEEKKMLRGRLMNNPDLTDRERLMIGMENAGLKVPTNMEAKPTTPKLVQVGPQGIFTPEDQAVGKPGYHPPQQQQTVTIQTVDDKGNPVTRVVPKSQAIGQDFAHPSAQDQQHTRTNRETLDTLDQLDQAIEAAAPLIGPGMGRVSNLEQMAGSADPKIQALGVKMKAAKMRVDHALTGSVRAGASPQMMQQWDNILANKVTPEGLKAGVQAMREVLGGSQPAKGGSGIKSITEIKD